MPRRRRLLPATSARPAASGVCKLTPTGAAEPTVSLTRRVDCRQLHHAPHARDPLVSGVVPRVCVVRVMRVLCAWGERCGLRGS